MIGLVQGATVRVTWDPNPEPYPIRYYIYDCGVLLTNVTGTNVVLCIEDGRMYRIQITAVPAETAGMESLKSDFLAFAVGEPLFSRDLVNWTPLPFGLYRFDHRQNEPPGGGFYRFR